MSEEQQLKIYQTVYPVHGMTQALQDKGLQFISLMKTNLKKQQLLGLPTMRMVINLGFQEPAQLLTKLSAYPIWLNTQEASFSQVLVKQPKWGHSHYRGINVGMLLQIMTLRL